MLDLHRVHSLFWAFSDLSPDLFLRFWTYFRAIPGLFLLILMASPVRYYSDEEVEDEQPSRWQQMFGSKKHESYSPKVRISNAYLDHHLTCPFKHEDELDAWISRVHTRSGLAAKATTKLRSNGQLPNQHQRTPLCSFVGLDSETITSLGVLLNKPMSTNTPMNPDESELQSGEESHTIVQRNTSLMERDSYSSAYEGKCSGSNEFVGTLKHKSPSKPDEAESYIEQLLSKGTIQFEENRRVHEFEVNDLADAMGEIMSATLPDSADESAQAVKTSASEFDEALYGLAEMGEVEIALSGVDLYSGLCSRHR
jgi:hypothetical protein